MSKTSIFKTMLKTWATTPPYLKLYRKLKPPLLKVKTISKIWAISPVHIFKTILVECIFTFYWNYTGCDCYGKWFLLQIRTSPFEDTAYFDTYGVDHLFQCTFGLLLRHVQEIIFSVTTLEDNNHDSNKQNKPTLLHSRMNVKQVHELSENLPWKRRLIDTTKALEAYFSFVDRLPKAAQLPKAIYCAVCQFGMIVLEVTGLFFVFLI